MVWDFVKFGFMFYTTTPPYFCQVRRLWGWEIGVTLYKWLGKVGLWIGEGLLLIGRFRVMGGGEGEFRYSYTTYTKRYIYQ